VSARKEFFFLHLEHSRTNFRIWTNRILLTSASRLQHIHLLHCTHSPHVHRARKPDVRRVVNCVSTHTTQPCAYVERCKCSAMYADKIRCRAYVCIVAEIFASTSSRVPENRIWSPYIHPDRTEMHTRRADHCPAPFGLCCCCCSRIVSVAEA
jgi:hypothetical protein